MAAINARALTAWCLVAACSWAHADVLFVDTNNAPLEIEAVQRSLAPGEKLWVIPSRMRLPKAQRDQATHAAIETARLTEVAKDCATDPAKTSAAACESLGTDLRQSELERQAALAGYSSASLLDELNELAADGRRWRSVVVSGHHEKGYFSGELVSLSKSQMGQLLVAALNQTDGAPNLLLLGCDTLTPQALHNVLLPAVHGWDDLLIVGAEDLAPTKYEARNTAFVERALKRTPALHRVSSVQQLQREQRFLRNNDWPVAIWLRGDYVALKGHQTVSRAQAQ